MLGESGSSGGCQEQQTAKDSKAWLEYLSWQPLTKPNRLCQCTWDCEYEHLQNYPDDAFLSKLFYIISRAYPGHIQGLSRATTRAYPGLMKNGEFAHALRNYIIFSIKIFFQQGLIQIFSLFISPG